MSSTKKGPEARIGAERELEPGAEGRQVNASHGGGAAETDVEVLAVVGHREIDLSGVAIELEVVDREAERRYHRRADRLVGRAREPRRDAEQRPEQEKQHKRARTGRSSDRPAELHFGRLLVRGHRARNVVGSPRAVMAWSWAPSVRSS